MTAGMAANRPMAVANNASAIPGATTARLEFCSAAMAAKLRMMPHTVPNRPMNGATEPVVARKFRRLARRSVSAAIVASIAVASRSRVPARSMFLPLVDSRHSAIPAAKTFATGSSFWACAFAKTAISELPQNSRSNASLFRLIPDIFTMKLMMIVHTQMLDSARPTMTDLTTKSASINKLKGEKPIFWVAISRLIDFLFCGSVYNWLERGNPMRRLSAGLAVG